MSLFADAVTRRMPHKVEPIGSGKTGALLATYDGGLQAVLKLVKERTPNGKLKQRGIEVATQPHREVAFYRLAELLGWTDIVSEAVLTTQVKHAPLAVAIAYKNAKHLKHIQPELADSEHPQWNRAFRSACASLDREELHRLLILDLIAGSRDRHSNNIGVRLALANGAPTFRVVGWDNACSFGLTFAKYHNVFHKYLFRESVNLTAWWPQLQLITREDLDYALGGLLTPLEIEHAYLRLQFILDFPYRVPWNALSLGEDDPAGFPNYHMYFEQKPVNQLRRTALKGSALVLRKSAESNVITL